MASCRMPWPTFAYFAYPPQHWLKIKTNNPVERLLKEARRRTKVVGSFPDGNSVLMLVVARLRHVSSTTWDTRKYMIRTISPTRRAQALSRLEKVLYRYSGEPKSLPGAAGSDVGARALWQ